MSPPTTFPLLGESPALDLVNTRMHRRGEAVELLASPAAFDDWTRTQAGHGAWHGHATREDLTAVLQLREVLHALFAAALAGTRPPRAATTALNRVLALPTPRPRLVWRNTGPRKTTSNHAQSPCDALLHALAEDGLDLLAGPRAGLLRECAHPDCTLLFLARDARRRWCSSTTCGNRARVARHYREHHGTA